MESASVAASTILTADMFSGLTDTITANLGVVIPIGLGIFGTLFGLRYAIRFLKSLVH